MWKMMKKAKLFLTRFLIVVIVLNSAMPAYATELPTNADEATYEWKLDEEADMFLCYQDGNLVTEKIVPDITGKYYVYVDDEGYIAEDLLVYYDFDEDYNGVECYYFAEETGYMVTDGTITYGPVEYTVAADGKAKPVDGWPAWSQDTDGNWICTLNGVTAQNQIVTDKNGTYYINENGIMAADVCIQWKDGYWYYFDTNGNMLTKAWHQDSTAGGWRYFNYQGRAKGSIEFQLEKINGIWYAFSADGLMHEGWVSSSSNSKARWFEADYYFIGNSSGKAADGFLDLEVYELTIDESGNVTTSENLVTYSFYFEKGKKVFGTTRVINGTKYIFDQYGVVAIVNCPVTGNHDEGTAATCTAKAVCSVCGESYGDTNADNHTAEPTYTPTTDGTQHIANYSCCGATVTEGHSFTDGKCISCSYECTHETYTDSICDLCKMTCEHDYANGICDDCGSYQPATLITADNRVDFDFTDDTYDGYYAIANAGQLMWFAEKINSGKTDIHGVLTDNIDLSNVVWTPIGNSSNNFNGTFDGNGHSIINLTADCTGTTSTGLFGVTSGATITNFSISGTITICDTQSNTTETGTGVVGIASNSTKISKVHSALNITVKSGVTCVRFAGGIVGELKASSVTECSYTGTIDLGATSVDQVGGIVGYVLNSGNASLTNCGFYGAISTSNTANSVGGILGYARNGSLTLTNCLSVGTLPESGANVTAFGTLNEAPKSISGLYYLAGSAPNAVVNYTPTAGTVLEVNSTQLESGKVAYLLGSAWGQNIGTDSYPTLGATPVSERYDFYGQSLNIGADLSMKYYVAAFGAGFDPSLLKTEFLFLGVKSEVNAVYDEETGLYVFTLGGINPQCMGDKIQATLIYNGETKVTKADYSVEDNLKNLLEKHADDAVLVALINDTLAYGEAASAYKGHETMTGTNYADNGSDREIPDTTVTLSAGFTGYTVVFGQMNFIKIRVTLDTGYTLYLDDVDITDQLVDGIFKTDGIAPTEFDQKFSFEIKNGDTDLQTFSVSVNDYIGALKDDSAVGDLVKALYNYGVSAKVYNHAKTGEGEHTYTYTDNGTHDTVCTVCGDVVADDE